MRLHRVEYMKSGHVLNPSRKYVAKKRKKTPSPEDSDGSSGEVLKV